MRTLERAGKNSKIIAKCKDGYLVTNDKNAKLEGKLFTASIINEKGIYLTGTYPIEKILRNEKIQWEPMEADCADVINFRQQNYSKDSLMGFATGDALGVPVEFCLKEQVRKIGLKEMVGNDTPLNFKSRWSEYIPSGSWSDDTSMLISSMDSIIQMKGTIHYEDIMKKFMEWRYEAKYTSIDMTFGVGGIISKALANYQKGMSPLECGGKGTWDNGNGSLMRILPFSLYCIKKDMALEETIEFIGKASALTHSHDISKMSCVMYTEYLRNICISHNAKVAFREMIKIDYKKYFSEEAVFAHRRLLTPVFAFISGEFINSSGYVVDTLEAVLYSVMNTNNYEEAVLTAINLGYDTDTVAGITGSIAGILYGYENIPERWICKLRKRDYLEGLAETFEETLETICKTQ